MLKKEITYEDPFGEGEITKTFYFNLTKAEITEWEYSIKGGLSDHLREIMEDPENNASEIMKAMKEIILRSYGERSGSDFVKSDDIRRRFESGEPYSVLFYELCTEADKAAEFINAIVPKDFQDANQTQLPLKDAMAEKLGIKKVDAPNLTQNGPRVLTRAEAVEMDSDELQSGLVTGRYTIESSS